MNRRLIGLVVLVVIVVGIGGYYEITQYNSGVVSTTVVNGQITGIVLSNANAGAGGVLANALGQAAGGGVVKAQSTSGASLITISVGSVSFEQIIACNKSTYYNGETVQVADELLKGGGHTYIANIACTGGVLPFHTMNLSTATTVTSTTSTTA